LLEDIRRKSPGTKQKKEETTATTATATDANTKSTDTISQNSVNEMRRIATNLQLQIDQLKKSRMELENNIDALKQTDQRIVDEMTSFNKSLNDKDTIVKEFLNVVSMNTKGKTEKGERSLVFHVFIYYIICR
jgi:osomolarity two-component system response regulator SKN7